MQMIICIREALKPGWTSGLDRRLSIVINLKSKIIRREKNLYSGIMTIGEKEWRKKQLF